ncbi:MAG: hypothetical protein F6K16_06855 [Symploca sp. SIO2B6]|nr:hypothetical protein [Symploca sp. SIO2B6]
MLEEFIPDTTETPAASVSRQSSPETTSSRESVKILVMGSLKGVNNMIQTLYRLGFAQPYEWSPPQPTANSGEVVSMLIRQLLIS